MLADDIKRFVQVYKESSCGKLSDSGAIKKEFPELTQRDISVLVKLFVGKRYTTGASKLKPLVIKMRKAGMRIKDISKKTGVNSRYVSQWTKGVNNERQY